MNEVTTTEKTQMLPALQMSEAELVEVLATSLYPNASVNSIKMVLGYCRAAGLDPMQKPVHIVPMWDAKSKSMRDVVMAGIGLYRVQAARSNSYGGITEPEFGPDVTEKVGGVEMTYPQWCKVTVKRRLPDGSTADFSAVERWKENYSTAGKDTAAPNAMWKKRPYGQLAKCAQAQALRMAFPEIGTAPTADEMEGKSLDDGMTIEAKPTKPAVTMPKSRTEGSKDAETPKATPPQEKPASDAAKPVSGGQLKWIENKVKALGLDLNEVLRENNVESFDTLTPEQFDKTKAYLLAM